MANSSMWKDRWAIVGGGTSGLGLELVRALASQGAHVAMIGRNRERLDMAVQTATNAGAASAIGFSVDLNCPEQFDDWAVFRDWLRDNDVDLLINATGRSDRGPLEMLNSQEILELFHDNVLSTWNLIKLALDSIKRSSGVIVNIGSLAGLIATPNMGGYAITKSALTAMTRQLRFELERYGVGVMLVCPGPIRREDSGHRYAGLSKSRGLDDPSLSAPAAGAQLKLIDPVHLSHQILNAAHQRRLEIVIPSKAKWLAGLMPIWPWLGGRILQRYVRS